jgi:hypothetical protein
MFLLIPVKIENFGYLPNLANHNINRNIIELWNLKPFKFL